MDCNFSLKHFMAALEAIVGNYKVSSFEDRYIIVENPDFDPEKGNDPNYVIDIAEVREFLWKGGVNF